jgi:hypothetical protein
MILNHRINETFHEGQEDWYHISLMIVDHQIIVKDDVYDY